MNGSKFAVISLTPQPLPRNASKGFFLAVEHLTTIKAFERIEKVAPVGTKVFQAARIAKTDCVFQAPVNTKYDFADENVFGLLLKEKHLSPRLHGLPLLSPQA